jgi:hypothetical protein
MSKSKKDQEEFDSVYRVLIKAIAKNIEEKEANITNEDGHVITNKPVRKRWNPTIFRCRVCKVEIFSKKPGYFDQCDCQEKPIAIDETEYYARRLGEPEQFENLGRLWEEGLNDDIH